MAKGQVKWTPQRGDHTREALIAAATSAFADDGFHAVTTRQIAGRAGVNQALIGYHFGGKDGLYLEVIKHVAARMLDLIGPLIDHIEQSLNKLTAESRPAELRKCLLPALLDLTDGMVAGLLDDRSADWAQLILREQQTPTVGFEVLYDGFMGRIAALITDVASKLRPDQDTTAHRLFAVTTMGQMMVLRSARTGVVRHMGWAVIDGAVIAQVQAHIRANLSVELTPNEPPSNPLRTGV
jgi:AcrR family transcriptional regulator